ncbi:MAG: purine-nucleoside phosphorylase [Chlorobiales bacterium]|nr:purine-nucleoside phosphorylase [Chlorobiales bacterium]
MKQAEFSTTTLTENRSSDAKVQEAVDYIRAKCTVPGRAVGIVLGSGLGGIVRHVQFVHAFDASEIPHYPAPSVDGHDGRFIIGLFGTHPVIVVQGRVHLYEGQGVEAAIFYTKLLSALGIRTLVLTNAAGGINPDFQVGDICLIRDHLNFMFEPELGRFTPATNKYHRPAYSPLLLSLMKQTALEARIEIKEGVYAGVKGPSYETRAEIRMLRNLGADLVGMSTVPEVVAANSLGMRTLALSLVSNPATGVGSKRLTHEEVKIAGEQAEEKLACLLEMFVSKQLG